MYEEFKKYKGACSSPLEKGGALDLCVGRGIDFIILFNPPTSRNAYTLPLLQGGLASNYIILWDIHLIYGSKPKMPH